MFPSNEAETITLYKLVQGLLGWEIVHLQRNFPDAVIAKNGKELAVEFEHQARNFKKHKHDPDNCDIIICWENNWKDSPLPVFALKDYIKDGRQGIQGMINRYEETLFKARNKIRKLERELEEEKAADIYDWDELPRLKWGGYKEQLMDFLLKASIVLSMGAHFYLTFTGSY